MFHRNTMASASLILGITAMLAGTMVFAAVPLGALSVLCAILSRTGKKFPRKSIIGMITGMIAAILSCAITYQSFSYIMNNPEVREYYGEVLDALYESYGLSDRYNPFSTGGAADDSASDVESETEDPSLREPSGSSNDEYFDSMYDDYFRYFYGADPYHEVTPEDPSGTNSGGDFV